MNKDRISKNGWAGIRIAIVVACLLLGGWYMTRMPGKSYQGELPPLTAAEMIIRDALREHVHYLAGTLGERNQWHKMQYDEAAHYIGKQFKSAGLTVSEETYLIDGTPIKNVIGELTGKEFPKKIILIGAHYDSVFGSPGADDNASGVAGLIEIAKLLKKARLPCTIRFVAFGNEEPPFFYSKQMGSWQHAKTARKKQENIIAMFSIESIGYYADKPNSQHYPLLFGLFYPDRANFIGFVGNLSSRTLTLQTIGLFRDKVSFPSEGIAAPRWIPGVGWSDQWSFWKHGYPAVMITDTALYRNPHYHTGSDRPETLDYDRMSRVVQGLAVIFIEIANDRS